VSVSHFNYTGRQRVRREHIKVAVAGQPPEVTIAVSFQLDDYRFPESASVVLEAQAGWTLQRFDWGRIGLITPPASLSLEEFDSLAGLLFRLKVVGRGVNDGIILGEADRIRPSGTIEGASQRSFIIVRPGDLGQVPWRLDFDENQPLLIINRRLGDYHELLQRKEVAALLLPEVLRQVLTRAASAGSDQDDDDSWQNQVIRFGEKIGDVSLPESDDDDEIARWTRDVVETFCRRHRFADGLAAALEVEE
jgi:hypothetical protein